MVPARARPVCVSWVISAWPPPNSFFITTQHVVIGSLLPLSSGWLPVLRCSSPVLIRRAFVARPACAANSAWKSPIDCICVRSSSFHQFSFRRDEHLPCRRRTAPCPALAQSAQSSRQRDRPPDPPVARSSGSDCRLQRGPDRLSGTQQGGTRSSHAEVWSVVSHEPSAEQAVESGDFLATRFDGRLGLAAELQASEGNPPCPGDEARRSITACAARPKPSSSARSRRIPGRRPSTINSRALGGGSLEMRSSPAGSMRC